MDDAILAKAVVEKDAQLFTALHAQDGAEVAAGHGLNGHAGAAQELALVSPDARRGARQDLHPLLGGSDGNLGIWHKRPHLRGAHPSQWGWIQRGGAYKSAQAT